MKHGVIARRDGFATAADWVAAAFDSQRAKERAVQARCLRSIDQKMIDYQRNAIAKDRRDLLDTARGLSSGLTRLPEDSWDYEELVDKVRLIDPEFRKRHESRFVYLITTLRIRLEIQTAASQNALDFEPTERLDLVCVRASPDFKETLWNQILAWPAELEVEDVSWPRSVTGEEHRSGHMAWHVSYLRHMRTLDYWDSPLPESEIDFHPGSGAIDEFMVAHVQRAARCVRIVRQATLEQLERRAHATLAATLLDEAGMGDILLRLKFDSALRLALEIGDAVTDAVLAADGRMAWSTARELATQEVESRSKADAQGLSTGLNLAS